MTCLTGHPATSRLRFLFNEDGVTQPMPLYQDLPTERFAIQSYTTHHAIFEPPTEKFANRYALAHQT